MPAAAVGYSGVKGVSRGGQADRPDPPARSLRQHSASACRSANAVLAASHPLRRVYGHAGAGTGLIRSRNARHSAARRDPPASLAQGQAVDLKTSSGARLLAYASHAVNGQASARETAIIA